MNDAQKQLGILGALLALLLIAAGWSALRLDDQRAAADAAAYELAECRLIAQRIEALRDQDAIASADDNSAEQEAALVRQIKDAGSAARLPDGWMQAQNVHIQHKPARRVGDSPYKRKPADLDIPGLSLPELAALLHELTYDTPLTVTDLHLRTPTGLGVSSRWKAVVTVSYLIYDPPKAD